MKSYIGKYGKQYLLCYKANPADSIIRGVLPVGAGEVPEGFVQTNGPDSDWTGLFESASGLMLYNPYYYEMKLHPTGWPPKSDGSLVHFIVNTVFEKLSDKTLAHLRRKHKLNIEDNVMLADGWSRSDIDTYARVLGVNDITLVQVN